MVGRSFLAGGPLVKLSAPVSESVRVQNDRIVQQWVPGVRNCHSTTGSQCPSARSGGQSARHPDANWDQEAKT